MYIFQLVKDWYIKYKLNKATLDNCAPNHYNGQLYYARVISIYDGDTITCALLLDGQIKQYKIRMHGYDSPEMKPSLKNANRDAEKAAAVAAKEYLANKIMGQLIVLKFEPPSFDKYGRLLVSVYHKKQEFFDFSFSKANYVTKATNINELMISSGHGVAYNGGTKSKFEQNYPSN